MTQLCITDSTACEFFTRVNEHYPSPFQERIAKPCIYLAMHQFETGKAIAPFLLKSACSGVF
jgi:hypothetical protein